MKAELIDYMGNDLMVVNAARVSFQKESKEFSEKDARLLNYLVEHKHTSPFRHPQLQFRIECPIFVERQLFKHQVGMSANSISGRYVDFSDSYYEITTLRKQSTDSKQGSTGQLDQTENEFYRIKIQKHIENSKNLYDELVQQGVAKEMARMILPLSLNTQFIWTGSLLAFIHLFNLRLKPDAQQETRELVQMIYSEIKNIGSFEHSLKAFGYKE